MKKRNLNLTIKRKPEVNSPRVIQWQIKEIEKKLKTLNFGRAFISYRYGLLHDEIEFQIWFSMNGFTLEELGLDASAQRNEIEEAILDFFYPTSEINRLQKKIAKLKRKIQRGKWVPRMTVLEAAAFLRCRPEQIKYLIRNKRVDSDLFVFLDRLDRVQKRRMITVESLEWYWHTRKNPKYWETKYVYKLWATPKEIQMIEAWFLEVGMKPGFRFERNHTKIPELQKVDRLK